VGTDQRFKNGFTIRAEKAPNRRGVVEVLKHFDGITDFAEFLPRVETGEFRGVWVAGGYPAGSWIDADTASRFSKLELLIVQDLFHSPLTDHAHVVLPAASFAERDGSYVNHGDHLQTFRWAVRPPAGVRVEGSVLQNLRQEGAMYRAAPVLEELAREIPYFAVAAQGVPATGVNLRANQLASEPSGQPQPAGVS
jgi:NADH-quinone oxidoreductase subunit G